jgi:hypothetical protein
VKLIQADKITTFIMTDDWHKLDGEYDYVENGKTFVIEYNHALKLVTVHGTGTEKQPKVYMWRGTKDSMTQKFRGWLCDTINFTLKEGK